jgi:hypothetical protein
VLAGLWSLRTQRIAYVLTGTSFLEGGARLVIGKHFGSLGSWEEVLLLREGVDVPFFDSLSVGALPVREPADLVGNVHIDSAEDALRYARLWTWAPVVTDPHGPRWIEIVPVSAVTADLLFGRTWDIDYDALERRIGELAPTRPLTADLLGYWLSQRNEPERQYLERYRDVGEGPERPCGVVTDEEWRRLGLEAAKAEAGSDGYVVTRWMNMQQTPEHRMEAPEEESKRVVLVEELITPDGQLTRTVVEERKLPPEAGFTLARHRIPMIL